MSYYCCIKMEGDTGYVMCPSEKHFNLQMEKMGYRYSKYRKGYPFPAEELPEVKEAFEPELRSRVQINVVHMSPSSQRE